MSHLLLFTYPVVKQIRTLSKEDERSGKVYSFLVCFKSNWTLKIKLRPTIPRTKNFTSFTIYLPCSKADPEPIKRDERSEVPPVAPPLKLDMPWLEFALLEPCFCCLSENALVLSFEKSRLFLSLFPAPKKKRWNILCMNFMGT